MKTMSLKALLPDVGRLLGISPHVLYLRQQSLTREGLLTVRPGRGPGSGVVASPESVATLLVAVLAGLSPADVAHQTRAFCDAVSAQGMCPLTGATNLKGAIAAILADTNLAKRVDEILVAPSHGQTFMRYDVPRPPPFTGPLPPPPPHPQRPSPPAKPQKSSVFVAVNHPRSPLSISVSIYAETIQAIAALVSTLEVDQ